MKTSLQLQLGQQLKMTPQLQQAIKLLQMSTMDLQTEIQNALESNPLLEVDESATEAPAKESEKTEKTEESSLDFDSTEVMPDDIREDMQTESEPVDSPDIDTRWDDIYVGASGTGGGGMEDDLIDQRNSSVESLADHLEWQLNLTKLSDRDLTIGLVIIDALDSDGYLLTPLEDLVIACERMMNISDRQKQNETDIGVETDEIEAVLHTIQNFDPVGIGARNLQECLSIQLKQLARQQDSKAINQACELIENHIDALGAANLNQIAKLCKASTEEMQEALAIIRHLDPKPGEQITPDETNYIVPDVIVKKKEQGWVIELNTETLPKLRVNSTYTNLLKGSSSGSDKDYLKNNLQEAKWFIKSIETRNETLLKVATTIVDFQRGFFEYGEEAMKPMVLHDVAEAIKMHESTVSRVTTQKYMLTPRGIIELKYFFSSHVSTSMGGECSSTAIRALIKKLIAAENPAKPLSDSKLAGLLQEQGIEVARRTVAKYRESLNIGSSSDRKRLI